MTKHLAGAGSLLLTLAGAAFADDHEDVTLYRVFVGDHAEPRITAFDLGEPEQRWSFDTTGQVKLFSVADGAVVAAVQSDNDAVHFLSSGVAFDAHGDHADITVEDPAAIETVLTGPRPFHLVDHGGSVIINYDRGGYAEILDGHDLAEGEIDVVSFPQARAHHGFVAALGDHWLSTVASDAPVEGDSAPSRVGLQAFDIEGNPTSDLATCTGIHGEAFSGAYLAAGCAEGVLTATAGPDGVTYEMLEYSADLPDGVTTGTLLGGSSIQIFLGNYGADGLVVVDPAGEPHFRYIELPFRRVDFVLDPARPSDGYILTEDGSLHRIDLLSASLGASAQVTEAYSMDGHWNDPRPRIAMAGDEIVVSDPNAGLVRRISAETLEEIGTIEVEGMPYNITVVGGSGLSH